MQRVNHRYGTISFRATAPALLVLLMLLSVPLAGWGKADSEDVIDSFLELLVPDPAISMPAQQVIERTWEPGFVPMVLEILNFSRDGGTVRRLVELLDARTGEKHGYDLDAWYNWLWSLDYEPYEDYGEFKSRLYGLIDDRFSAYFDSGRYTRIRLDEIRWGGVVQDGIPPLRSPSMVAARDANYLSDENIVFGLEIGGDVRAYPKRILAWHEMFVDEIGGVPVCGVYCTLCGSMILYVSEIDGVAHELGTSGFLYRSNKLMYDKETQSLWNTLWGMPVVGPLAEKRVGLKRLSVVTTTWGEWRRRHPQTTVLSLDTGHERDYSEGAAYRKYFASDELMFAVPELDRRLRNKEDVLGLVFASRPDQPLAIAAAYLAEHPIYHDSVDDVRFVVLTDASGANRVYDASGVTFTGWDGDRTVTDSEGIVWALSESELVAENGQVLLRLPAHRAFWFGWYSAYSHTRLVR